MHLKKLKQKLLFRSSRVEHSQSSQANGQPGYEQQPKSPTSHSSPTGSKPAPSCSPDGSSRESQLKPKAGDTPIRDLWSLAYEHLREREEELIVDYEAKLRGNLTAALGSGSRAHRRDQMCTILQRKMDEVNRDAWKLKFGGSEVQVKDLVQPVLGVVNWANEYITAALSANSSASIAWGGVSLLLPHNVA